jgi:S-adenosyl-L-methionine hydrolase (adenosine-forming)
MCCAAEPVGDGRLGIDSAPGSCAGSLVMHETRFQPSGVITLTTDFGLRDPFVGVMKGRILARFPAASIVDLTHEVPAQAAEEAGFWLARSFEAFAPGTVHVAVVDPGVGTARAILCGEIAGHLLLAPDNGLLGAFPAKGFEPAVRALTQAPLTALGIQAVSATFHGRDIFAPVAAELAAGRCAPADLGALVSEWERGRHEIPALRQGALRGAVVTIDRFGNLITNIEGAALGSVSRPQVRIGPHVAPLRRTYGEAQAGELLALVNAFGVLEVAIAQGSASEELGLGRGTPVEVREDTGVLLGGANPL